MKRISALFLIFTVSAVSVFAQKNQQPVSRIPASDPFTIGRGTLFSASTSQKTVGQPQNLIPGNQIIQDFSEALEIIRKNYIDGSQIDLNELTKSSISTMLHGLDPHSNYFDASEFQELLNDQQSEYFGIGATISNYTKNGLTETYIVSTFPDSPAFRAGLRFGDKIIAVNGENMTGKNSSIVRDKVRGKKGTIAHLLIERANSKIRETVEIRRNRVPQPSIPDAYILRQGIGYIDMTEGFNYTTAEELTVSLGELKKQGMTSLILDLRDNTGGILDQAVKVAEKFLPFGNVIVTQRGRFSIDNRTWKSTSKTPENMPLVVLVDGQTASASEIVSGALQDYDRALIIGENTFGKGLVQSILNLPFGSGLTLTTAKYYTPSGRSIQRDYSKAGLYDYFNHKINDPNFKRTETKTLTGRKVYGGDGITPDEIVKNQSLTENQLALLDSIFFFSTELATGKIPGFENYQISGQSKYGQRVRPADYPVGDDVVSAYLAFSAKTAEWKVFGEKSASDKDFIKLRIRYNLITAAFGAISANQILIEDDIQVSKAVENLPRAGQLAQLANKTRQKQNK